MRPVTQARIAHSDPECLSRQLRHGIRPGEDESSRGTEPHSMLRSSPDVMRSLSASRSTKPVESPLSYNCSHAKNVLSSFLLRKVGRWCRLQLCVREAPMKLVLIIAAVCYLLPRHRSVHKGAYQLISSASYIFRIPIITASIQRFPYLAIDTADRRLRAMSAIYQRQGGS